MAGNGRQPRVQILDTSCTDRNNGPTKSLEGTVLTDLLPFPHERLSSPGTFIHSYRSSQYNSKINFYCVQAQQAFVVLRIAPPIKAGSILGTINPAES